MACMRPLAGITVIDCTRVLAGPYCTMLLGDLGADVIKIEQPGRGDDTRTWGPPFVGGESPYFWTANRNKRSLTLDLARAEGQMIVRRLIERGHILVENFKVGTLDRWGLDDATLHSINPALVHTAITAYGPDGPRAAAPGYDALLQAESGWMSVTGTPDGPPMKVGMALVDLLTGLYAANATLAALRVAETSGQGQRVDCNLWQSALAGLINLGSAYLATGNTPQRWGNAHATIVPYQLFETADQPIVLAVGNDRQWQRCCEVLDRVAWSADQRFATNPARVAHRATLVPLLQAVLRQQAAEHWIRLLRDVDVPVGPVNTIPQAFADPQSLHLGLHAAIDHPTAGTINLMTPPFSFSLSPADVRLPPPVLGQHTDAILQEADFTPDQITAFRTAGII